MGNTNVGGLFFAAIFMLGAAATDSRADSPDAIGESLSKAVTYLYSLQHDGNWENVPAPDPTAMHDSTEGGQWGGLTGIATYALLSAGESPNDPRIKSAVQWLMHAKLRGTYAIAMRAQVWQFLATSPEVQQGASRDAKLLLDGVKGKGDARGLWFYHVDDPKDDRADNSASQFAVLGVWACAEAGVEIPDNFWKVEDATWRQHQMAEGAWAYVYNDRDAWGKPYLSMTCAGLATLFLTQDKLNVLAQLNCTGNKSDPNIERGLGWVSQNFPEDFNNPGPKAFIPYTGNRLLYAMFAMQRLGMASGYRYFGKWDWFKSGSQYLLQTQGENGGWGNTVWETSFGILFMARGGAPIVFEKLNYCASDQKIPAAWNERPRDLANVTSWMSKQDERRLNWEIVDINADAADWMDSPVMYISGNSELKLGDGQMLKLKTYVESGGLIVGTADCASPHFSASFRKLGKAIFPEYEFRQLPADHPIFTLEQFHGEKFRRPTNTLGLSNGVRELMLLFPDADLSRQWQMQTTLSRGDVFQLAANISQYTVPSSKLRNKGNGYWVTADPAITAGRTIKIARLKYPGNWNPEPGGWRRLAGILHDQQKIDLDAEAVELGRGKLDHSYAAAHLTGTTKFALSDACRQELRKYVDGGGTLVIDSAGGQGDFSASAETELAAMFPGNKPQRLAADDPIFAGPVILGKFQYRHFAKRSMGASDNARMMGVTVNKRLAVIYSPLDLSAGLVGNDVDGVSGYEPETATAVMEDILVATPPVVANAGK